MTHALRWLLTCTLLAWPGLAAADVGDPGPPPKPCTLDAQVAPGLDCVTCDGAAPDAQACERRWAPARYDPDGWRRACRTPGQAKWTEIWCRKHVPTPPARRTPPEVASHLRAVTASSTMPASAGYEFEPGMLTDGDVTTSWQPERSKGGKGETALFSFDADVALQGLAIANGFQVEDRFGDEFVNNSRLKAARLVFSDGSEERITLPADQRGLVEVGFKPRKTRWLKLIVEEVHPGAKWKDLAISEVVFLPAAAEAK